MSIPEYLLNSTDTLTSLDEFDRSKDQQAQLQDSEPINTLFQEMRILKNQFAKLNEKMEESCKEGDQRFGTSTLKDKENELEHLRKENMKLKLAISSSNLTKENITLTGELQRMKLTVRDKETEVQLMKELCDSLTKQLHTAESKCQNLQTSIERLSAELAKTTEDEEQLRKRVNDLGKNISTKDHQTHDLQEKISKLKKVLQDRVTGLQRAIAQLDAKKRETESAAQRLKKDNQSLKKNMNHLEKERNARAEEALRLSSERANPDSTVKGVEGDLSALAKRSHELEALLAEQEQAHAHRILELTSRHRQEADSEMERLRSAHGQSERTLESRERAHRQSIRGLEEQITTLKDQLALEIRRKQAYLKEAVRSSN